MTDRNQGYRVDTRERQWLMAMTGPFDVVESRSNDAWRSLAEQIETLPPVLDRGEWLSVCHIRESRWSNAASITSFLAVSARR